MEKLKDILHDCTDILLALVIMSVMFFVVSFYLGDWFQGGQPVLASGPDPVVTPSLPDQENDPENMLEVITPESDPEDTVDPTAPTDPTEPNDSEEPDEGEEAPPAPPEPPSPPVNEATKTIVIPNGTPGVGIASILYENGLIESTAEFVRVAEALELSLSLKSGTFEIPTDATVEEMVRIIARRN